MKCMLVFMEQYSLGMCSSCQVHSVSLYWKMVAIVLQAKRSQTF